MNNVVATSVLDVEVSCFASYQGKEPRSVNLLTWLSSNKYANRINQIRSLSNKQERDRIKATLPAVTVSGLFYPRRRAEYLIQHSGLICIDIDYKDNKHVGNYSQLKELLFNISQVAYVGLSASGTGFFVIIPIQHPEDHVLHYQALEEDFSRLNVVIDPAPKSVVALRGYSYDPNAFFRHHPITYTGLTTSKMLLKRKNTVKSKGCGQRPNQYPHTVPISQEEQVIHLISQILSKRVDITIQEPNWFKIACALANEFGEAGRDYYHSISQFHPNYQYAETDKKYTHALRRRYKDIGIGTLFKIANDYL